MIGSSFIAINVGNTRSQVARFENVEALQQKKVSNENVPAIVQEVITLFKEISDSGTPFIVMASVNDEVANKVQSAVKDQLKCDVYQIGDDLPVPIGTQLDPETITGVDRLLNAAGAYATVKQACVVVDAGTAITVDFVDGNGTFHGGAIAPGGKLQMRAMHEHTSALPEIEFTTPDDEPFGRSTSQAMQQGVYFGMRGLVWKLVERYAEAYGAFPQVVATGGDAEILFKDDELINNIVPDLALLGIAETVRVAVSVTAGEDGNDPKPHINP